MLRSFSASLRVLCGERLLDSRVFVVMICEVVYRA